MRAPHEALRVHGEAIREFTTLGIQRYERATIRDLAARQIEVVGEHAVAKAFGVIHGAVVRTPARAVGADHLLALACHLARTLEAVQAAGGRHPFLVAHGASPQAARAIALCVIEAIVRLVRLRIVRARHRAGVPVHEGERLAQRQHQSASATQVHAGHDVVDGDEGVVTGTRVESLHAIAADVDPVQHAHGGAPDRRLAHDRVVLPDAFRLDGVHDASSLRATGVVERMTDVPWMWGAVRMLAMPPAHTSRMPSSAVMSSASCHTIQPMTPENTTTE